MRYAITDKWTGDALAEVPDLAPEQVEESIARARVAFERWSAQPAHRRASALSRAADLVNEQESELAELLARETGKTLSDALIEIRTTARVFRGFAEEATRHFGQAIELDRQEGLEGDLLITRHEPVGVVVAITPFNFPAELYAHKVAAGLAAGNAVIVKPAEPNPLIARRLTELLHEGGVDEDALQCLTGRGATVGSALTSSAGVDAIAFTGSTIVGRQIATAAAQNLIRVMLELGGNDAFIVDADADIDNAVAEAFAGRTFSNGQVCVATKRIILVESIADEFTRKLIELVAAVRVGGALDGDATIGPLISEQAAEKVERQVDAAVAAGGRVLHPGARSGALYAPSVISVPKDSDVARDEEIFGPVFSLIRVVDLDEGVRVANSSSYGLNAAVFTRDLGRGYRVAARLQAGIVSVNGGNLYRPDGSAFGGYKKSGFGREGFFYSLDEFTQLKTIALRGIRSDSA